MKSKSSNLQTFLSRISKKLALLAGASFAAAPGLPANAHAVPTPSEVQPGSSQIQTTTALRTLPKKLILKQTKAGFKMVAQHDSHSSHSSHDSHSSHSSHSSHTSSAM